MAVRVGVDVGGTFTKAVACDVDSHEVVARSVVATTHASSVGVAQGVVEAIGAVEEEVGRSGMGPVLVVAHSTTQAVNALLEGDTATVGVLGMRRSPDLRRSAKRTKVGQIKLAPGRNLETLHEFIDVTPGLDDAAVEAAIGRLIDRGAGAICVSEAFGVEDPRREVQALEVARRMGVAACAAHELSGIYGLEVRTVTAALNTSILPTALATADVVEAALGGAAGSTPLLVMRGDGGAADARILRRQPLQTAFSGPAASVTGALRRVSPGGGIVVEVGGTSTNVSLIRHGRPVLSYVRVFEHVTCVRSLDVRVVGVAGGSLLRMTKRLGRPRLVDVGPRSAHIAGLPYACFAEASAFDAARFSLVSPRPEDPPEYCVVEAGSTRYALTPTCAANALGRVPAGSHAEGDRTAAVRAFGVAASALGTSWEALARRTLEIAASKIKDVVAATLEEHSASVPTIIGLGGAAGAVVPEVARRMELDLVVPPDAEVISSIGDALSLVRVEIEQALDTSDTAALRGFHRKAEAAAVAAGAAPASVQVQSEAVPERSALRVIATGSLALQSGAVSGPPAADEEAMRLIAKAALEDDVELVASNDFYRIFRATSGDNRRFAVVDGQGSLALAGAGEIVSCRGGDLAARAGPIVARMTRHLGPMSIAPGVRLVQGARLVDLTLLSSPDKVARAITEECAGVEDEVTALLSPT